VIALVLLVGAVACVAGGVVLLAPGDARVDARITGCDVGFVRTGGPDCRGTWELDGEQVEGQVVGATSDEVGSSVGVVVSPGSITAEVARGRTVSAVIALVLGVALGAGAVALLVSRLRKRLPGAEPAAVGLARCAGCC
jgi:hypothetical protein